MKRFPVFKKLDEMAEAERLEQEKLLKEKQENRTRISELLCIIVL